jgi:hypothetical protein
MDEINFLKHNVAGYFVWLHGAEAMERLRTELHNDVGFYSNTRRAIRLCLRKTYAEGTLMNLVQKDFGNGTLDPSDEAARLWLRQMFGLLFSSPPESANPIPVATPSTDQIG